MGQAHQSVSLFHIRLLKAYHRAIPERYLIVGGLSRIVLAYARITSLVFVLVFVSPRNLRVKATLTMEARVGIDHFQERLLDKDCSFCWEIKLTLILPNHTYFNSVGVRFGVRIQE